jgi:hypothetical protein
MVINFSDGRSRSTWRKPPTMVIETSQVVLNFGRTVYIKKKIRPSSSNIIHFNSQFNLFSTIPQCYHIAIVGLPYNSYKPITYDPLGVLTPLSTIFQQYHGDKF